MAKAVVSNLKWSLRFFPLRSEVIKTKRVKQIFSCALKTNVLSPLMHNTVMEMLTNAIRQEQEIKMLVRKKDVKLVF